MLVLRVAACLRGVTVRRAWRRAWRCAWRARQVVRVAIRASLRGTASSGKAAGVTGVQLALGRLVVVLLLHHATAAVDLCGAVIASGHAGHRRLPQPSGCHLLRAMLRGDLRLRGQLRGGGLDLCGGAGGVFVVGVILYKLLRPRIRDARRQRWDDDAAGHGAEGNLGLILDTVALARPRFQARDAGLVRGLPRHDLGGQNAVGEQLDDWARHGPGVSHGLMVPRGLGAGHGVAGAQMSAWCPDTLPESMTMSRAASLPALNSQGPSPCSESGVMSGSWPGVRVAKNSATRC